MASLLITGGEGFIGVNFVRYWREKHPNDAIVVLDALTYAGNKASVDDVENITFLHADMRDYDMVETALKDHKIDTLVHFAAERHVDRSIHGPDAFIDTNVNGTHSLLKAAKAVWLESGSGTPHRFHHVFTDEVYGSLGPYDPPLPRPHPMCPIRPIPPAKRPKTIWCESIITLMG